MRSFLSVSLSWESGYIEGSEIDDGDHYVEVGPWHLEVGVFTPLLNILPIGISGVVRLFGCIYMYVRVNSICSARVRRYRNMR